MLEQNCIGRPEEQCITDAASAAVGRQRPPCFEVRDLSRRFKSEVQQGSIDGMAE